MVHRYRLPVETGPAYPTAVYLLPGNIMQHHDAWVYLFYDIPGDLIGLEIAYAV